MSLEDRLFDSGRPLEIADQGCFFVGGRYLQTDSGPVLCGQMFVQFQVPRVLKYPHPVVMIHGGGQTGANFLGTPDGRRGWADDFVAHGYAVYVLDQPARGRSGYFPEAYGPAVHRHADAIAERFSAPETRKAYPQAHLHTQWPGSGLPGDEVFDQFYASQVESVTDISAIERMMREAGSTLLDRIGPAVLLTHSQAGPFGWTIADARPALVRAILAVEPNGPPLHEVKFTGPPDDFDDAELTRHWGITRGPLEFDPPVASAVEMCFERENEAEAPGRVRCWLQAEPARRLPNLADIPILIVTAEASYHAPYDHCTSKFLRQAGVEHDFVRLESVGIRGNGHMMMLEKNNLEIAAFLRRWLEAKTLGAGEAA
jgi:pimeloyl-ACP methyl ester carboxylesterase